MAIALQISSLSLEQKEFIVETCTITTKPDIYNPTPLTLESYKVNKVDDEILIPMGMWKYFLSATAGFPNGEANTYPPMNPNAKYVKTLLTIETDPDKRGRDQDVIVDTALKKLEENGSVFLGVFTGAGKSSMGIYISIYLKLKTIVLCHLDIVKSQWPDEYAKFSGGSVKVQYVKGSKKMDPDADVYIVGIKKVLNISDKELSLIGTVIVDEAHISTVTAFTQSLLKFRPRYLVGLSATYDRNDGLHKLLYPYYGSPDNFIIRKEKKEFTVFKVQTPYEPRIKYVRKNGQRIVDWATVIKSIEENPLRWQNVVDVVMQYPNEKMIILCNRQVQAKGIYNLCLKYEEDAVLLIGDTKVWDKTKRITVTSFKKGGVGLNMPDLTFAIIASDTSDVRQYEGRIRTTNNIIYHFVDHYEAFEKHYKVCEKWYREKGATINVINVLV